MIDKTMVLYYSSFIFRGGSLSRSGSVTESVCQHLVKLEEKEVLVDPQSDEGHVQYTIHHTCCPSIFY